MKLFVRWLITAISVGVAAWLVPGIHVSDSSAWLAVGIMAVALGIVNIFLRPVLTFLSCGFVVLTLGLFMFVVNGLVFWAASWMSSSWFNVGFHVDNLWAAMLGSIVVSIVSFLITIALPDKE
jgi:putative membrane protein